MPPDKHGLSTRPLIADSHSVWFSAAKKEFLSGGTAWVGMLASAGGFALSLFCKPLLNLKCQFRKKYYVIRIVGAKCCVWVCAQWFPSSAARFHHRSLLKLLCVWALGTGGSHRSYWGRGRGRAARLWHGAGGRAAPFPCPQMLPWSCCLVKSPLETAISLFKLNFQMGAKCTSVA